MQIQYTVKNKWETMQRNSFLELQTIDLEPYLSDIRDIIFEDKLYENISKEFDNLYRYILFFDSNVNIIMQKIFSLIDAFAVEKKLVEFYRILNYKKTFNHSIDIKKSIKQFFVNDKNNFLGISNNHYENNERKISIGLQIEDNIKTIFSDSEYKEIFKSFANITIDSKTENEIIKIIVLSFDESTDEMLLPLNIYTLNNLVFSEFKFFYYKIKNDLLNFVLLFFFGKNFLKQLIKKISYEIQINYKASDDYIKKSIKIKKILNDFNDKNLKRDFEEFINILKNFKFNKIKDNLDYFYNQKIIEINALLKAIKDFS